MAGPSMKPVELEELAASSMKPVHLEEMAGPSMKPVELEELDPMGDVDKQRLKWETINEDQQVWDALDEQRNLSKNSEMLTVYAVSRGYLYWMLSFVFGCSNAMYRHACLFTETCMLVCR
ncbi:uncharacterized protein [Lolium perenne]|nr:uncharacterized protein LOC127344765 [Lolium perenne]